MASLFLRPASNSPTTGLTSRSSTRDGSSPIACTGTPRRSWPSSGWCQRRLPP